MVLFSLLPACPGDALRRRPFPAAGLFPEAGHRRHTVNSHRYGGRHGYRAGGADGADAAAGTTGRFYFHNFGAGHIIHSSVSLVGSAAADLEAGGDRHFADGAGGYQFSFGPARHRKICFKAGGGFFKRAPGNVDGGLV